MPAEPTPTTLRPSTEGRYSRHLRLPEVGHEGQKKLAAAKVLVVGAGGLGSPAALYLAAAGVGTLGLVDFDAVDLSNLQRQVLYSTRDAGRPKLEAARERLLGLNPEIDVVPFDCRLTPGNALGILKDFDVVVDGTDNFPARYLVNDACVLLGKPNVYGSVFRFEGQVSVFWEGKGPCYRCLHPEPPPPGTVPSCAQAGVLGVLPGIIGSIQAAEALKLILGAGKPLIGELLLFDALAMEFKKLALRKDPDCRVRGLKEEPMFPKSAVPEISVEQLKAKLEKKEKFILVDVREQDEYDHCRIPGSTLIPLAQLPGRVGELDKSAEIVVHCHAGGRSAQAVRFLLDKGFSKAFNVAGGIGAWSARVDPSVPTY